MESIMIDKNEFEKMQRDYNEIKEEKRLLDVQLEEIQLEFQALIEENDSLKEKSKLDKIVVDKMFTVRENRMERELWNIARKNQELKKEIKVLQLDRGLILDNFTDELNKEKKRSEHYQNGLAEIRLEFDEISAENQQMKKVTPKLTKMARKNRDYIEEIKVLKATLKWLQRKRQVEKNRMNDLIQSYKKKSTKNQRLEDTRKALQARLRDAASLPYSLKDLYSLK